MTTNAPDATDQTRTHQETSTETETKTETDASRLSSLAALVRRVLLDLVVVGVWVGFLTVIFLRSGGPRWAFYTLLLLGVLAYTMATGR